MTVVVCAACGLHQLVARPMDERGAWTFCTGCDRHPDECSCAVAPKEGFSKCRYQESDCCHNWTAEGLTYGTSKAYLGPPDESGRSTLVDYPSPICRPCFELKTRVGVGEQ